LLAEGATGILVKLTSEIVRKIQATMSNSVTTEVERDTVIELILCVCKCANSIDDISVHLPKLVQLVHAEILKKETALELMKRYSQVLTTILCSSALQNAELLEAELNFSLEALQGKVFVNLDALYSYRLQK